MKCKLLTIGACLTALLLLSACSVGQTTKPDSTQTPDNKEQQETSTNQGDIETSMGTVTQRWAADEFRQNEEDTLFFAPETDDYMLTEVYGLEQSDTGVIYTLTILRSFDEAGKVISQKEKYSFDIPMDASYCYTTFSKDGNSYPSLVCVGYSVCVEQIANVVAEQRTKEQFIRDYKEDDTKHWLSIP